MDQATFREAMLRVMERKTHWAWPGFTTGLVPKHLLHVHLEQEYAVYVRDFPVLIGRAYVQCPIAAVRRELAENLFEEETGGLVAGRPHPELFLEYPLGLGMDLRRFDNVHLLPNAAVYRAALDHATTDRGWEIAAAVTTIFLEGTSGERSEIQPGGSKRPPALLSEHPLVKHYGLPQDRLALTKAHRKVEGEHRLSAWRVMLDFVPEGTRRSVLASMEDVLTAWLNYRDDVAYACGLQKSSTGAPLLLSGAGRTDPVGV